LTLVVSVIQLITTVIDLAEGSEKRITAIWQFCSVSAKLE